MGILLSLFYSDETKKSKNIDKLLLKDFHEHRPEIKLLLLGTEECGKSTVLKQMKIVYTKGYSEEERRWFISDIHQNILDGIVAIINAMDKLNIEFFNQEMTQKAVSIVEFATNIERSKMESLKRLLTPDIVQNIFELWSNDNVQECYSRSNEFYLLDCASYFLNNLERISNREYIPTDLDIVSCRVQTTQIVEERFPIKRSESSLKVIDVGGQRGHRTKWHHYFSDVTCVIFVAALSDYDITVSDDPSTNRMKESLLVFKSICKEECFKETGIILFLNKVDIFKKKLKINSIQKCFGDYNGKDSYEESSEYIRTQFEKKNSRLRMYTHFTCATDTQAFKFVLQAVTDIVIELNLAVCGMA